MLSEQLKELIHLAVVPGCFDEDKRAVIYRRADAENTPRKEVDQLIINKLSQKYGREITPVGSETSYKKSFFLKRVYVNGIKYFITNLLCDGNIIKARRNHKYFLFGRPVEFTIPVADMMYFDNFSKIGYRKRAEFGTPDVQWSIRLVKSEARKLKQVCINNLARFSWPDFSIIKSKQTKSHRLTQPLLWVSNDYIVKSHNCLSSTEQREMVRVKDVAFFTKNKDGLNSRTMNVYFGYYDQIDISGIKPEIAEALEHHCKVHGAKIGLEELADFKPSFNLSHYLTPSKWFTKERILVTEEAVIYYCKKLLKTECTYLPYKDVKVARFGWGLTGRHINLFGIQNIMTHYTFPNQKCIVPLKDMLDKHGVKPGLARVYNTWPWFRFLGSDTITMVSDGLCLIARKYNWDGTYGKRKAYYIPYEDIYHFEKFSWYFLWKTHYIKAKVRNIRKDQMAEAVDLKLKRLWFRCDLFSKLKRSEAKQDMNWYHDACKNDNKNY